MAALFLDGFDHYASADMLYKYVSGTMGTVAGRFGGQANRRATGTGSQAVSNVLPASGDTRIVGFAFRTTAFNFPEPRIFDMGSLEIRISSGGTIQVCRATNNVLVSAPTPLSTNVWYHIEVVVFHHASTGTISLRFNGVEVASGSSLNTGSAGVQFVLRQMSNGAGQPTWDIDDLFVLDGSGGVNDTARGDCKIETGWPTGAGTTTQWDPSAGSNYQNVDDSTAIDEDTTYNSTAVVNEIDTFAMTDLTTTGGDVYAVQVSTTARKTDAGLRQIANVLRHSGTDYPQDTFTLLSDYQQTRDVLDLDPAGGAWSIADVNALEAGYKLIA